MFNVSEALKLATFAIADFNLTLAMDIHRNTSDILFTAGNIENIIRSIEDKQDRFIKYFEEREANLAAEIREVSQRITVALNSLELLSGTFNESLSSLREAIQVIVAAMLTQAQAQLLAQQVRLTTN